MEIFETPDGVSLQIRLPSGHVKVTTVDEPRTTVEVVSKRGRGAAANENVVVRADERHGGHVVTIEQRDKFRWGPIQVSWGGGLEVLITCPPGTDLDLGGGSTDVWVEGELGEVSAKTASGDIRVEEVRKKLEARTASGDISIGTLPAGGTVVTVSGDLDVRRVLAPLIARSVSGDVRIGAIEAGKLQLQTVSGDVQIGVARGTRVWIDAVSVSGDLESELGLADDVPEEGAEAGVSGEIVPLEVKTVSGDVKVVRAAAALST
jgi:hypothetical protein